VPELPEVETVVRGLRSCLLDKRISSVMATGKRLRLPMPAASQKKLLGRKFSEVARRGKWIILVLDNDSRLLIHLGMTGQLRVQPAKEAVQPHTHLIMGLGRGGEQLRFRDVRRFGGATLLPSGPALNLFFEKSGLGPEPFELKQDYWERVISSTRRCLKAVLLDQRVLAGVGNIYADEALFEARVHPAQLGVGTSNRESARLRRALVRVLERAITCRGSSIRDYLGASGHKGRYQNEFRVYGQSGKPCPRCRFGIERIQLAGRSTHFCPRCQVLVSTTHAKTMRNGQT
jgi:formamidopyrimidine-DNA glycosylase